GIVGVTQNFHVSLIQLVCHAAIFIVMPAGCLVFSIGQSEHLVRGIVSELENLIVGVGLVLQPACGIADEPCGMVEGIDDVGQPARGVNVAVGCVGNEVLIQCDTGYEPVHKIVGVGDSNAIAVESGLHSAVIIVTV